MSSLETLIQALGNATSQTSEATRKAGESQLRALQGTSGFLASLLDVYRSDSNSFEVRWMAVIYLKNSVENAWRKSTESNLHPDEKAYVRDQLLEVAALPLEPRLNNQFAVVVAKIAKQDFPRTWPSLFEDLQARIVYEASDKAIQSGNLRPLNNLLVTLYQTIKLLGRVRIGPTRSRLVELTPSFVKLTSDLYMHLMSDPTPERMVLAYPALKAACTLIYDGNDRAHRQDAPQQFFDKTLDILKQLLTMWDATRQEIVSKHARRLGKLYIRLLVKNPIAFALMPRAMDILGFYQDIIVGKAGQLLSADTDEHEQAQWVEFYDKIVIQGMTVIKNVLQVVQRDPVNVNAALLPLAMRPRDEHDRQDLMAAYHSVNGNYFFANNHLHSLVNTLLTQYFLLRSSDVQMWKDDPEEYFLQDSESSYEFKTSSCARTLFHALLKTFPIIAPQVLQFVESVSQKELQTDGDVLEFEAALQCLEYGAGVFSNQSQIEPMLIQVFLPRLAAMEVDLFRVIRRRLCLVIAEWIPIQGSPEMRQIVYRLACEVLFSQSPLNDLLVQLAAVQALKTTVDDIDFDVDEFLPYVEPTFAKLYDLLNNEVESLDIKRFLLEVVSVMVEQLGPRLSESHIQSILRVLPPLWEEKAEDQLIKCVVLQTLTNLVDAAKEKSALCYPVAETCLLVAADRKSLFYSYLIEDGLDLWRSLVVNSTEPNPTVLSLFPMLVDLLESSTEHISEELNIMESYLKLEPAIVADEATTLKLFNLCALYLPTASVEDTMSLLTVVELMFAAQEPRVYFQPLVQTGIVPALAKLALVDEDGDGGIVVSIRAAKVYAALSWFAFQDPQRFVESVDPQILPKLVSNWISKFDGLGDPRQRKLSCLGVTRVLAAAPQLFAHLNKPYIDMWSTLLDEVSETNGDAQVYHEVVLYPGETEEDLTPEQIRQQNKRGTDPVHTVDLRELVRATVAILNQDPQTSSALGGWSV